MSYKLVIRPEAEADMAEQFDWYQLQKEGLGHDFLSEVNSVLEKIQENPLRYSEVYRNTRRALVRRFPFKLFYLFDAGVVEVLAVIHARRDPRQWQRRAL